MNNQQTPAARVIQAFGTAPKLARAIKLDVSCVYRWNYPSARGGSNGLIPAQHQRAILTAAWDQHINLCPADLVDAPSPWNWEKSPHREMEAS